MKRLPDTAYNYGANHASQLKNFIYEMKSLTKSKSERHFGAIEYSGGICHLNPDVTKLFSAVSPRELTSFQQGIACILSDMGAL